MTNRTITAIHFEPGRFDDLPLPGGRTAKDVEHLHAVIVDQLKIPGTSHTQGRTALLQTYSDFLDGIGTKGAEAAIGDYLAKALPQ